MKKRLTWNGATALLATMGIVAWAFSADQLGSSIAYWTGAVGVPLAMGAIGLLLRGGILERLAFTMLPALLYGAVFLIPAFSSRADPDARSLLVVFVAYWAVTGSLAFLALFYLMRILKSKLIV